MSVWKKIMLLCAVALLSLAVVGCGGGDKKGKPKVEAPAVRKYEVSEKVPIQVYLDGTVSMAGYVSNGSSEYVKAINAIDKVARSGIWKGEEQKDVKYIKFGDKFQNLDRENYLQFNNADFYDQTNTNLPGVIRQIKASSGANPLSIVVTDLFQTDQDIDSLNWALGETCFGEGKAVAVVGVKSQFDGEIYDVGRDKEKFKYASKSDVGSFRPVYLLVTGLDTDVREFVLAYQKEYVNRESEKQDVKVAFFTHNIGVNSELSVDEDSVRSIKEMHREALKALTSIPLADKREVPYLRMKKDKKSGAILNLASSKIIGKYPDDDDDYTIEDARLERWTDPKDGAAAFREDSSIDVEKFLKGSKIKKLSFAKGKAEGEYALLVNSSGIKNKEGVYRLTFNILPEKAKYLKKVNTFKDWSFAQEDIKGEASMVRLGSKTQNIDSFVNSLAQLNYARNKPGFYDLWVYFEVK